MLMRTLHIFLALPSCQEELTCLKNEIGFASTLNLSLVMGLQEYLSPFEGVEKATSQGTRHCSGGVVMYIEPPCINVSIDGGVFTLLSSLRGQATFF
jgi:hypothetical protein